MNKKRKKYLIISMLFVALIFTIIIISVLYIFVIRKSKPENVTVPNMEIISKSKTFNYKDSKITIEILSGIPYITIHPNENPVLFTNGIHSIIENVTPKVVDVTMFTTEYENLPFFLFLISDGTVEYAEVTSNENSYTIIGKEKIKDLTNVTSIACSREKSKFTNTDNTEFEVEYNLITFNKSDNSIQKYSEAALLINTNSSISN